MKTAASLMHAIATNASHPERAFTPRRITGSRDCYMPKPLRQNKWPHWEVTSSRGRLAAGSQNQFKERMLKSGYYAVRSAGARPKDAQRWCYLAFGFVGGVVGLGAGEGAGAGLGEPAASGGFCPKFNVRASQCPAGAWRA